MRIFSIVLCLLFLVSCSDKEESLDMLDEKLEHELKESKNEISIQQSMIIRLNNSLDSCKKLLADPCIRSTDSFHKDSIYNNLFVVLYYDNVNDRSKNFTLIKHKPHNIYQFDFSLNSKHDRKPVYDYLKSIGEFYNNRAKSGVIQGKYFVSNIIELDKPYVLLEFTDYMCDLDCFYIYGKAQLVNDRYVLCGFYNRLTSKIEKDNTMISSDPERIVFIDKNSYSNDDYWWGSLFVRVFLQDLTLKSKGIQSYSYTAMTDTVKKIDYEYNKRDRIVTSQILRRDESHIDWVVEETKYYDLDTLNIN